MKLENTTRWPARLFRMATADDMVYCSLLARVPFVIGAHGLVLGGPAGGGGGAEPPPPEGTFQPRTGTDLIVLGDAVAAEGPVRQLDVQVVAGPPGAPVYDVRLRVFGDRRWVRSDDGLVPSEPTPFETMPLTYAHAYGGAAAPEAVAQPYAAGDTLAFADNPEGKGYYHTEAQAEGAPLPNIEDPAALIERWTDQPAPVGFCPYPREWGLRLMSAIDVDAEAGKLRFAPERGMFDRAHPALSGRRLGPGDEVRVTGVGAQGAVRFALPDGPVACAVQLGRGVQELDLTLEEVEVDLRQGRVELSYRRLFHYPLVRHQTRRTLLRGNTQRASHGQQ